MGDAKDFLLFSVIYTWHGQKGDNFGFKMVFLVSKSIEAFFTKSWYKTKSWCLAYFHIKTIGKLIHYQKKIYHNFGSGVEIGLNFGLEVFNGI